MLACETNIDVILQTQLEDEFEKLKEWKDHNNKQTPWPESASELYRPSDRLLSSKLLPVKIPQKSISDH
jgi:hypothetical protein